MTILEQVLFDLVKPMVEHEAALQVKQVKEDEREVVLNILADDSDVARLIGRHGAMASALRQVMSVASHSMDKQVSIQFGHQEDAQ